MIEIANLTKRYGATTAVDDLTFRAEDGLVTGFLGPNGAGKSTTMRMMLGLDRPDEGWAHVDGMALHEHRSPQRVVGALLDAGSAAPTMTARAHLRWVARAGALADTRVEEVLDMVGLGSVGDRRVGSMSLGMRQRLGIATALLGDPGTLILDEPINGLDPDGVVWARTMFTRLADEGRAVLISSHLMSEMQLTADKVVIVGRGALIAELTVSDVHAASRRAPVRLRVARGEELLEALRRHHPGMQVEQIGPDGGAEPDRGLLLRVTGLRPEQIGDAAAATGTPVYELAPERESLEDVYMRLTRDAGEYVAVDQRGVPA